MPVECLSLSTLSSSDLSDGLMRSFRTTGFAMVTDHGIDPALIARGWAYCGTLFALPDTAKQRYVLENGGGQRGYTPFGREIAKGAQRPDLKEFWHVGREDGATPDMPANIWPDEMPGFRETMLALFAAFDAVGAQILSAVASGLGLTPDWFAPAIDRGNSILRLLHYPPVADGATGVRAGAHEDINLITLLLGAEEAGLELRMADGHWHAISPPPGALAINVGDMLQRLTNHRLPSTSHRVVNPAGLASARSRYAMPYFLHFNSDFLIEPLPQCVDAALPPRDRPITAGDYLSERLAEIGLAPMDRA
jgi:isopenicillin N synthase-like dioxygenase